MPWPQRWELLRERALPVLCFVATLAACGWLWQRQASVAPFAVGEVRGRSVVVKSPCDGEVLPLDAAAEVAPLFAKVDKGAVAVRVKQADAGGQVVDVTAPLTGQIAALAVLPGELVEKGDPLFTLAAPVPEYIVCHVADEGQQLPKVGAVVAVRRQARGAPWTPATVEAVGPALEPPPAFLNGVAAAASRLRPLRISLPKDSHLAPGSLVEVRLAPASL
jgi:hypothetical protein